MGAMTALCVRACVCARVCGRLPQCHHTHIASTPSDNATTLDLKPCACNGACLGVCGRDVWADDTDTRVDAAPPCAHRPPHIDTHTPTHTHATGTQNGTTMSPPVLVSPVSPVCRRPMLTLRQDMLDGFGAEVDGGTYNITEEVGLPDMAEGKR